MSNDNEELARVWKQLSDLTHELCRNCPAGPFACCTPELCHTAIDWAFDTYGKRVKENKGALPCMGCKGCVLAPHMRPECTTVVCAVAFRADWNKQKAYNALLRQALEMQRKAF